ncbi:MAG: hypothetical protein L3J74_02940 [Bacteroidales bacterium]|nr:hypothetical protein [Bacteroidales bacterium]
MDTNTETEGTFYFIKDGTVKIEKSGDEYEITLDCTLLTGEKLSGYFKGTPKNYDYSLKKTLKAKMSLKR